MRRVTCLIVLSASLLLPGLAGCCGGEMSEDSPSPPPARAEGGGGPVLVGRGAAHGGAPPVAPPSTGQPAAGPPAFGLALRVRHPDDADGTYLTARDGGHHSIDALVTTATTAGPYEKFKLERMQPDYTLIKTSGGYYVSAAGNGGLGASYDETQILQTDRTGLADDALFRMHSSIPGYAAFTLQTYGGYYLTALGGGGKPTRAFHTDATTASTWEDYWVTKCGDLGSGYDYAIVTKGTGLPLAATNGGGLVKNALVSGGLPATARFKLDRQSDGSYSLQTSNRVNYITAILGGGLSSGTADWDNLVTDRTQVRAWETFRIVDQGNCTYTIQTTNGWYVATAPGRPISTRISDPAAAPSIGYSASFELVPFM